tara:strand:- start:9074 stop:9985 length:912 start_codon:yes stop_codon:yes gene_type:complete
MKRKHIEAFPNFLLLENYVPLTRFGESKKLATDHSAMRNVYIRDDENHDVPGFARDIERNVSKLKSITGQTVQELVQIRDELQRVNNTNGYSKKYIKEIEKDFYDILDEHKESIENHDVYLLLEEFDKQMYDTDVVHDVRDQKLHHAANSMIFNHLKWTKQQSENRIEELEEDIRQLLDEKESADASWPETFLEDGSGYRPKWYDYMSKDRRMDLGWTLKEVEKMKVPFKPIQVRAYPHMPDSFTVRSIYDDSRHPIVNISIPSPVDDQTNGQSRRKRRRRRSRKSNTRQKKSKSVGKRFARR